jgi:hypothetical protein
MLDMLPIHSVCVGGSFEAAVVSDVIFCFDVTACQSLKSDMLVVLGFCLSSVLAQQLVAREHCAEEGRTCALSDGTRTLCGIDRDLNDRFCHPAVCDPTPRQCGWGLSRECKSKGAECRMDGRLGECDSLLVCQLVDTDCTNDVWATRAVVEVDVSAERATRVLGTRRAR